MCISAEQLCNAKEVQELIYDPSTPTMPTEPRKFPAAPRSTRRYRVAARRQRLLSTISESAEVDFPDDVQAYARQTSAPARVRFALADEIIRIHARSNGETGMSGDSENSETPASPGGAEAEDSGLAQLTAGRREAMRKRLEQLLSVSFDDLQGLHGRSEPEDAVDLC
mmetsp:Transcript_41023/g.97838  ORF Transcript_41023/g.97838 Transcript_41023/m.97838 type:complete len:168 (+) Transcript_41023:79-582(+)